MSANGFKSVVDIDLMGPFAYQVDGTLDREFVAGRVFSDPIARKRIGEIVHPHVHAAFRLQAIEAERNGALAIIREAAGRALLRLP